MEGDNRISSMVIDCGLKNMDAEPKAKLSDVVKDIGKTLTPADKDNPELDFLVVTHEHWDHVSGFAPSRKLFDDFQIAQVWMAWTEDPDDPIARQINTRLDKGRRALAIAGEKMKLNLSNNQDFYQQLYQGDHLFTLRESFNKRLTEVIGLSNLEAKAVTTTESGIDIKKFTISEGTEAALRHAKSLVKDSADVKYFSPGKIIQDRRKFPGIRMYVLGPPRNARINKDLPSEGNDKETYFVLRDASMDGFVNGLLSLQEGAQALPEDGVPFGYVSCMTKAEAIQTQLYKESYFAEEKKWRTIEEDWMSISGVLALQMDNDTNNTSLALAMEFVDTGQVLLFPGDAQVGSWESWHDVTFSITDQGISRKVTTTDLLNRTILYKVSHHASHNATLKEKGLELMISDELVALIPEKKNSYPGIPHPPLVERLEQKTRGRLVFSADSDYPANSYKDNKPSGLSIEEWEDFKNRLIIEDLYIELSIQANQ
ncbi:MAG: hypothetical protein KA821_03950 [Chitinophagaceae bacterium]|nr:hypothetical protein [Chitinophagaceae bacterium]